MASNRYAKHTYFLAYLTLSFQRALQLAPEQRPSIDECIRHKAFTNEVISNDDTTQTAEKSEPLKTPDLALNSCEDQK